MKQAVKQYIDAFNDELESFKERIRGRAKIRIEEAMKEVEEVGLSNIILLVQQFLLQLKDENWSKIC